MKKRIPGLVIPRLGRGIHDHNSKMDCPVKPGNDSVRWSFSQVINLR
ncbi:MAG: hypothetical protein HQK83_01090 [Fibrobacteria bacterium]|nr:hypothetical protein [Fibrobacteria bacterium]